MTVCYLKLLWQILVLWYNKITTVRLNNEELNLFNEIKQHLQSKNKNRLTTISESWRFILKTASDKPVNADYNVKRNDRNIKQTIRLNNVEQAKIDNLKQEFKTAEAIEINTADLLRYCLLVTHKSVIGVVSND